MSYFKTLLLVLCLTFVAVGCSSGDAESTAPDSKMSSGDKMASTTNEEKAKCDGCGAEVPKAELASHDGKMMCKACMAAHQHG